MSYFMINFHKSYVAKLGFELLCLDLQSDMQMTALLSPANISTDDFQE